MRLYDGVDVSLLSDQQLKTEYDIINQYQYDDFYQNKLGYLWFRLREICYEIERRGIEEYPPTSFVGKQKHCFGYWTPSFKEVYNAKVRVNIDMKDDHSYYGKPISRRHRQSIVPLF